MEDIDYFIIVIIFAAVSILLALCRLLLRCQNNREEDRDPLLGNRNSDSRVINDILSSGSTQQIERSGAAAQRGTGWTFVDHSGTGHTSTYQGATRYTSGVHGATGYTSGASHGTGYSTRPQVGTDFDNSRPRAAPGYSAVQVGASVHGASHQPPAYDAAMREPGVYDRGSGEVNPQGYHPAAIMVDPPPQYEAVPTAPPPE